MLRFSGEPDGAPTIVPGEAPGAGAAGRRGQPRSTTMHLHTLQTARRIGARHGMKWALVWVAVALIAAPAIGRYIEKQGR